MRSWGNMSFTLGLWALVPLKAAFFPLCSSHCTPIAASAISTLSSWSSHNTTLIGLISGEDEYTYRWEIDHVVIWGGQSNLELNALKTVEMIVDFRKTQPHLPPSPCVSPQSSQWSPSASGPTCQRQWWCTYIPPSLSPSSPPPLPSGTLLPLQRTRTDCNISFASQRRSLAAIYHHARTLKHAGKNVDDPSHPGHKLFWDFPLQQEAAVYRDQNLSSLPIVTSHYINVKPPHLTPCITITHSLWIIISVHCTFSLYFILWTFAHSLVNIMLIPAQTVQLFHFKKTDVLYCTYLIYNIYFCWFFYFVSWLLQFLLFIFFLLQCLLLWSKTPR